MPGFLSERDAGKRSPRLSSEICRTRGLEFDQGRVYTICFAGHIAGMERVKAGIDRMPLVAVLKPGADRLRAKIDLEIKDIDRPKGKTEILIRRSDAARS